ncbi:Serine carboxypeptidase 3 [Sesamum angolense]|uniref:Carboxypeptidase n=1 Tax=Sesamum angolense TaxID=2727404 RepID=A0AAE1XB39_9LAMI|nr:Serine carboxypeptidase 3 [Sesamum angolense]
MASASSLTQSILSVLVLCLVSTTSTSAETKDGDSLFMSASSLEFPRTQAERLIRALNLFPKNEVNHHAGKDHGFGASRIVEKRFKFPFLGDSGASVQDLGHHAGYYRLQHSKDARYNAVLTMLIFLYLDPSEEFVCVYLFPRDFPSHFDATPDIFMIGMMFYFFFESRNSRTDPVVIWLTGGPGCSSELALFYENGPFHITKNLSLTWNDFGWDKVSNLIYVDQPTGTGFSYSSDDDDIRHNEKGVSNDLYDFLQAFFKEHPQYAKNDFYITGESYAGHYIPAFAARVHQGNKRKEGIHINLKGFAIGNGLTNPEIQYQAYTDYALDMKLITKSDYNSMKMSVSRCQQAIKLCGANGGSSCVAAYMVCNVVFNNIVRISGGKNYYDIRKECEGNLCYDFSSVEDFLNLKSVRDALGVGDIDFVSCSSSVYEAMVTDIMRNLEVGLPALLEDGIKLLVYAGEYDLICNWIGNSRWVHAMEWSGQKKFVAAPTIPFSVDGLEAGLQKGHGPLTFLKVHNAGHMVPMDQPKASLEMLRRWMQGKLTQAEDHLSPM